MGRSVIPSSAARRTSVALAGLALACTVFCGNSIAWSATRTWNSTATATGWSIASNWGGTVPGSADIGRFAAASYTSQPSLTTTANVGGIWDTGGGAITIGGNSALTLFGTTINSNTGTGIEVDPGAGPLTVNAPLVLQNDQQWINNSLKSLTVNGNISATGSLTKIGSGTLALTGSNTFGGTLTVDGGTLQIPSGSLTADTEYVGNNGIGTVTQTGGTNTVTNTFSIGVNPGSSGTYNLSGGLLVVNGMFGGAGSSSLNISGGTLTGNSVGGVSIVLNSTKAATFDVPVNPLAVTSGISGSGGITKTGSATLTLNLPTTFTGNTTILQGAVELADANALQNSTVIVDVDYGLLFSSSVFGDTFNVGGLAGGNALMLDDDASNPVTLAVGGNNANTTYSGSIMGDGGLVKSGTGKLTLTGSNSFTGGLVLDPGIVAINGDAALGAAPASPATNITFEANSTLQALGSFALSASRNIVINPSTTATFDTQGYTLTIGGSISGSGGLAKAGTGTLILYGSNSYTGGTIVPSGTLKLDFSQAGAPTTNIINNLSDSSSLALGGGTLVIQGNANTIDSQRFNGLTVNPGSSAIVLTTAGTSNPLLLSLGNITHNVVGGTIDFTLPGGTQSATNGITTTAPNTAGILGGYATVSGTNWAASTGTAGNITAYSAYTRGDLGALSSGNTLNVSPSGSQSHVTSAKSFNTLNLTGSEGVTMTGSGSLTLLAGGLIGATSGAIGGGTLAGSASGELIVITPANLTIGSVIADNGGATALTKAGSATLILTGSNTYNGVTTIDAGVLQIGNGGDSGALGRGMVTDNSALVFDLSGATTFGGTISGVGSLTQAGNGELILSGSNDYAGRTTVSAGALCITNPAALPGETSLTVGPGGTFVFDPMAGGSVLAHAMPTPDSASWRTDAAAVPEPGTLALVLAAVALLGLCRWAASPRGRAVHPARTY